MSKSNSSTISFSLVLSAGSIDRQASLAAAEAALDAHIAESETQNETIANAVAAVFEAHRGIYITMPTIEALVGQYLNATPANYKTLSTLALNYVRANSGTRESGAMFGVKKGVGGGCCVWAHMPETETNSK